MVLTSSRIVSCEVWLILMRRTSAPASNKRRIIALSEEAGPSVARILMRRRRLMVCFRARAADQTCPEAPRPADWAGRASHPADLAGRARRPANWTDPEGHRVRQGQPFPGYPAPAAPAVH